MPERPPLEVLIAGGGPAAVEAALRLHRLAGDRVRITLLAAEHDYVMRPMTVLEPFAAGRAERRPLHQLAARASAVVHPGTLASVDPSAREVTTAEGETLRYGALLVATGARPEPALAHALSFGTRESVMQMHGLIQDLEQGYVRSIAFVVPDGVAWPLPLYELALMTAQRAWETGQPAELTLATPESEPLELFGSEPSRLAAQALADAGVTLRTGVHARAPEGGGVVLEPGRERIEAQRVVALARLAGPALPGLPADEGGFVPVDPHGRVEGVEDVWAAGDVTSFPVKQGGLACQQADAAAASIAAAAGAGNRSWPFDPVLHGVLITERSARFLRAEGEQSEVAAGAMWWPPTKIAGEELSQVLEDVGIPRRPPVAGAEVEVRLPVHAL